MAAVSSRTLAAMKPGPPFGTRTLHHLSIAWYQKWPTGPTNVAPNRAVKKARRMSYSASPLLLLLPLPPTAEEPGDGPATAFCFLPRCCCCCCLSSSSCCCW